MYKFPNYKMHFPTTCLLMILITITSWKQLGDKNKYCKPIKSYKELLIVKGGFYHHVIQLLKNQNFKYEATRITNHRMTIH